MEQACEALTQAGVDNVVVHWREYNDLFNQSEADRLGSLLDEMTCLRKKTSGGIEVFGVITHEHEV